MTKADTTRIGWAYETTPGTAALKLAGDTAYRFGDRDPQIKKYQAMTIENLIAVYNVYNSRTPKFVKGGRGFPTFKQIFNPITAQPFVWAKGKTTINGGGAGVHTFEPLLTTEEQYPLTIRWEEVGGTNDRVIQAVGSYCVGLFARAYYGNRFLVQTEWAFQTIEDDGDSRPILTTAPGAAGGADVDAIYNGSPIVVYDVGGGSEATLTDVVGAEWTIKRNYTPVLNSTKTAQTIYLEGFEPVELILTALMEDDAKWDDFIDFNIRDYSVQVKKPDNTNYITNLFDNVAPLRAIKTADVDKGLIESKLICKAEKVTGTFTFEGAGAWATHFKGVVV